MKIKNNQIKEELINQSRKVDISLHSVSKYKDSLALDYMLNSKFTDLKIKAMAPRSQAFYNPFVLTRAAQPFKRYEDALIVSLAGYENNNKIKNIFDVLKSRKSTKNYFKKDLSLGDIYYLMNYAYGITRVEKLHEGLIPWHFRTVPSPGGLFSSEIYFISLNSHLSKGLYHYRPDINSLELIKEGDFKNFVKKSAGIDSYIDSYESIGGLIITTSLIERLYIKYGERSYRFMLLEVGFIAQNLSIIAEALDLGSCMLGGYIDDDINNFIGIDGLMETVQNVMVIGNKFKN